MKKYLLFLLLFASAFFLLGQTEVWTAQDLNSVRYNLNGHYIQMQDINISHIANWEPIGGANNRFTGVYNGGGNVVVGLTINRPTTAFQGLFGAVQEGGKIVNLGVVDVNVRGGMYTAGLVGYLSHTNRSFVLNCYSTGTVVGGSTTGGLVGLSQSGTKIHNSYSRCDVTGTEYTGGLVGFNNFGSIVSNCYSTGLVTGQANSIGGLVGYNSEYSVINTSYWDIESSGRETSAGGFGRTTLEMTYPYTINTYSTWSFPTEWVADVEFVNGLNPGENDGYPYLAAYLGPVVTEIIIYGEPDGENDETTPPSIIYIPIEGTEEYQYTAKVYDQQGIVMPDEIVVWSIEDIPYGLTLEAETGLITVSYLAQPTQFGLIATSVSTPGVSSDELLITLAKLYLLSLETEPDNTGVVSGQGYYPAGSTVLLSAMPYEGYAFASWSIGNDVISTDNPYNFTMPAHDETIVAQFVEVYPLNLECNPINTGIAFGDGQYPAGMMVDVSAEASAGFSFVNWTNEDDTVISELAEFQFEMPAEAVTLTANFEICYNLSLRSDPDYAGDTSGSGSYPAGAIIPITALPDEGFAFVNWTYNNNDFISEESPYSFVMPADDVTIVAHFEQLFYTLSLEINPEIGGTASGDGEYTFGSQVFLSAAASPNFSFINWTIGDEVISDLASFTYIMPSSNVTITANFGEFYTLIVEVNPIYAGTATGGGTFLEGEHISLNATAYIGYSFLNWTVDDEEISTDNPFSYTMPSHNTTVTANFELSSPVDDSTIDDLYSKTGNYPNPFNPATNIFFTVKNATIVSLNIYNPKGQLIKTLIDNSVLSPKKYEFLWNGTDIEGVEMSSGVYYYKLNIGAEKPVIRKIMLLK